jgi:hypothetical protein
MGSKSSQTLPAAALAIVLAIVLGFTQFNQPATGADARSPIGADASATTTDATDDAATSADGQLLPPNPPAFVSVGDIELLPPHDEPALFHGYYCSDDCSEHEAGYEWAQAHEITNPDACPADGNDSQEFVEGCWAYAGRDGG